MTVKGSRMREIRTYCLTRGRGPVAASGPDAEAELQARPGLGDGDRTRGRQASGASEVDDDGLVADADDQVAEAVAVEVQF